MRVKKSHDCLVFFWSPVPGNFVCKTTGEGVVVNDKITGPLFRGTQQEWNETLVETIIDLRNTLQQQVVKTTGLQYRPKSIVVNCNSAVFVRLSTTVLYHPISQTGGEIFGMEIKCRVSPNLTLSQHRDVADTDVDPKWWATAGVLMKATFVTTRLLSRKQKTLTGYVHVISPTEK